MTAWALENPMLTFLLALGFVTITTARVKHQLRCRHAEEQRRKAEKP